MEKIIEKIIHSAQIKEAHASHAPIIKSVFLKLRKIFLELDIEQGEGRREKGEGISYTIQRIQIRTLLNTLTKLLEAIITLLDGKNYESIDPLARVAMEHSVNVIYLNRGKKNERSKQLLKHYIETTLEKSDFWYKFAQKHCNDVAADIALKKINFLKELKVGHSGLYDRSIGKWPSPFKRFEECGYEAEYVTLYAMNSDSVHSLSEDAYNYCTVSNYPDELQEHVIRNYRALSLSMSVYLSIKSVYFYGLTINSICQLLKSNHDISNIVNELHDITLEHEEENFQRWS
ncbi:DUF5677 domain-containing protein [Aeromonas veronii]|nr:DUF5677 domain-containing protein [Aeromonas veronii]UUM69670.1 DUF5677 domain-containing protein [Aeromonas veronii]